MHLETTQKDGYKYYRICRSVRKGKKVKKEVVLYLGKLSEENLAEWGHALLAFSDKNVLDHSAELDERITVHNALHLGDIAILHSIWQFWGLDKFFDSDSSAVLLTPSKLAEIMAINRCRDPRSKRDTSNWYAKVAGEEVFGIPLHSIQREDNLYEAMDELLPYKESFENRIRHRLSSLCSEPVRELFYDLTSCYFEGVHCVLGRYGYSRDHREDREQVVIALVTTKQGIPLYHEVFKGNQDDKTSLAQVEYRIKNIFPGVRTTFIADRGLNSAKNIEMLKDDHFDYVLCLNKTQIHAIRDAARKAGAVMVEVKPGLLATDYMANGKRYIICENLNKSKNDKAYREQRIKRGLGILEKMQKTVAEGKLKSTAIILKRVTKELVTHHADIWFNYDVVKNKEDKPEFVYSIREKTEERKQDQDGVFVIQTSRMDLSIPDIISAYKTLQMVERSFRSMKTDLELRPVYHHKEERVRSHVLLCVMAQLLVATLQIQLDRENLDLSAMDLLDEAENVHLCRLEMKRKPGQQPIIIKKMTDIPKVIENYLAIQKLNLGKYLSM